MSYPPARIITGRELREGWARTRMLTGGVSSRVRHEVRRIAVTGILLFLDPLKGDRSAVTGKDEPVDDPAQPAQRLRPEMR